MKMAMSRAAAKRVGGPHLWKGRGAEWMFMAISGTEAGGGLRAAPLSLPQGPGRPENVTTRR